MIYYSTVFPYLHYAITAWGNCALIHQERLLKLQKRAIRIIDHAPFLAHSTPIFHSLGILQFRDIYLFQTGVFMYLCQNNLLPKSLLNLFTFNSDFHNYNTRNAGNFHLPIMRTVLNQKSIVFQGPSLWNLIPSEIRCSFSLNLFKYKYKRYLCDRLLI